MGCTESLPQTDYSGRLNVPNQNPNRPRNNLEAKVVLLGDSGVGKSSIALRFCQRRFNQNHEVTIGAAFQQQIVGLPDGQIKLNIWDTGGQERFRAMAPLYYRDAHGAVIVYDCNDPNSYESVKFWAQELEQKGPPNVKLAVAANKSDCDDNKKVDPALAADFCSENNILFMETSAKTGQGVGDLFQKLASQIKQQMVIDA